MVRYKKQEKYLGDNKSWSAQFNYTIVLIEQFYNGHQMIHIQQLAMSFSFYSHKLPQYFIGILCEKSIQSDNC